MNNSRPKIIISTAMMGQLWPEQWGEVVNFVEALLKREGFLHEVGLEIVAAYKEPLLSIVLNKVKKLGLANKVETIHGRVDYDMAAIEGRRQAIKGLKFLELLSYDFLMAWVGEAYRGATSFENAKLLLHAPTMFQLEVIKGKKPRMKKSRIVVENDEKLEFPFGEEEMASKMMEVGDPFNPVDVLDFVERKGFAKMVFDTAHFWRCFPNQEKLEREWEVFLKKAGKKS